MLFLLVIITCLILQFFLPWWIVGVVAFLFASWVAKSGLQAFGSSFLALFILWVLMGLIHSVPNNHLLANRVGQMFMLPEQNFNWAILLLGTGLIGGLAAGFSGLAGFYCRQIFNKRR